VITIHDLHFLDRPDRTQAEIRRDYPALVRRHAHRADRIITPSRFTAQQVERRLGVSADRIAVCPHGAPAWPARTKRPTGGYVLFLGTLEPRKNIGGLLKAFEQLLQSPRGARGGHPPELVLAGGAADEAQPWLDRIAQPPLRGSVRWIGYVNPSDRYALYQGARMLVLPSFEEGFGLPVIEAMTVGVPVVASNRGALPEVLGDAGPLVDPDDTEALAAAIERMLDDDSYVDACTARGLERARQFNWSATAQQVCEAYADAIERHRSSHGR
jgi:glycosyltransferase involved in cell wall biosynthesis